MRIISTSPSETSRIGKKLGRLLAAGDIVCLYGGLGSGKTVLARGISLGLGVKGCRATSPTFVLMRCLSGRIKFYHFDLYRINRPQELFGLGYEEFFFSDGVCVIEWAERLGGLVPGQRLEVHLNLAGGTRRSLRLTGRGKRYLELLADFRSVYSGPERKKGQRR